MPDKKVKGGGAGTLPEGPLGALHLDGNADGVEVLVQGVEENQASWNQTNTPTNGS